MFVNIMGEIYRVLLHDEDGAWIISYGHPLQPQYIDAAHFSTVQRIQTPEEYIEQTKQEKTAAQQERYRLIEPLLKSERYIINAKARNHLIAEIAAREKTTARRIQGLYYSYLATGVQTKPKQNRESQKRPEYEWAIKTYYLSSKRHSLKMAYDMLILSHYTNPDGTVLEKIPSWYSFRHYYERHWRPKEKQKKIAREGLGEYQRNGRMAYGSAMQWREKIGSFQMDATQADVYLVSRFDRSKVIGRPNIVLAVDTCTQLIAGVYVGLESGENAVLSCLANTAANKAAYCASYGIEITEEQWPCNGVIAQEIITDQGGEFLGGRMDDFLIRYGIERHALPPFRPDEKGLVEKAFDLLQECYKPTARKGNDWQ